MLFIPIAQNNTHNHWCQAVMKFLFNTLLWHEKVNAIAFVKGNVMLLNPLKQNLSPSLPKESEQRKLENGLVLVRSNVHTLRKILLTLGMIAVSITLELRLGNSNYWAFYLFLNSITAQMIIRRPEHIQDTQLYSLLEHDFPHCLILH